METLWTVIATDAQAFTVAVYIFLLYWAKELMELLLRVVYGVDRRALYVPVAQNVRAEAAYLGNVRQYQRGDLFYYVFHSVVSFALAVIGFIIAKIVFRVTSPGPPPSKL